VTAAGNYRTIRFVTLVPKCNALVLGSLSKQGRHPVSTSSDIGVGRHQYSRPYAVLDNKLITGGGEDIFSPLESYQNHKHLHVIFTQETFYDFKTMHPPVCSFNQKSFDTSVYPHSSHVLTYDGERKVCPVHIVIVYGEVEV